MLEFKQIAHSYVGTGGNLPVLRHIDFSVAPGELVCLLGPSGCGKSTLLHMASGFITPTTGEVHYHGKKVERPGKERALVFQDAALMPWLSVEENIAMAMQTEQSGSLRLKAFAAHKREEIERVLTVVGLKGFSTAMPHELSIGMRQKAAIARTLAMKSSLLLMDEPFASLDEQTRLRLNRELVDIWIQEKNSILFVTHSIQEALVLGTRILLMSARPGCILAEWNLPGNHKSGIERQQERLNSPQLHALSQEILQKMELCCPPGSNKACRCTERG